MKKFRVNIWHAISLDGFLSAHGIGFSARSPELDISHSHTLKHTVEVEAGDCLAACSKALEKALAGYPPLPELEPGHIRVLAWNEERRTDANDIFIVFDLESGVCEGEYLYCGAREQNSFVKVQILDASLTGQAVH